MPAHTKILWKAIIPLLFCTLSSAQTDKIPLGTYSLSVVQRSTARTESNAPSCGNKTNNTLKALSATTVVYAKSLLVNKEEWIIKDRAFDTGDGKAVHGATTIGQDVQVSLYFSNVKDSGNDAWGMLIIATMGFAGQIACLDAFTLAGTFKKT